MSQRHLIWAATILGLIVTALAYTFSLTLVRGAIAATRDSARFSGLVFALALIARASRPALLARNKAGLTLAFVAAHGVHFGTIIARAAIEPGNPLRHFALQNVLVVGFGFGITATVAFTARAKSQAGSRTNAVAFYIVWTLFAVAFGASFRTAAASAVMFIVVVLAMFWRVAGTFLPASRRMSAAAGSET
jgi:hypothetical protein